MDSRILTNSLKSDFSSKRKKQKDSFDSGIKSTYIALLSIISMLLLYYVWILNVNATKWYDIRTLEREKRELSIEKELLEVKIAELESLSNILDEQETRYMIEAKNPEYLVVKKWVQYVYNN